MKQHKHKWKRFARSNKTIEFRCECKETLSRPLTKAEKAWKVQWDKQEREGAIMHKVNRDFYRTFVEKGRTGGPIQWKWTGWELMHRIDEWAKKHPKDVLRGGCDDSHHTSSDLIFILHRVGRRLWGTTVYYIPQVDGQTPVEFFLYPSQAFGLVRLLKKLETYAPWDKVQALFRNFHRKSEKAKKKLLAKWRRQRKPKVR